MARIGLHVDDDAEIGVEGGGDGRVQHVQQLAARGGVGGQERAGIDGQTDEIEPGRAQPTEVVRGRHRPVRLEGRPVIVGARCGKFARQREPGPGVDAAPKLRRGGAGDWRDRERAKGRRRGQRRPQHPPARPACHAVPADARLVAMASAAVTPSKRQASFS